MSGSALFVISSTFVDVTPSSSAAIHGEDRPPQHIEELIVALSDDLRERLL